MNQAVSCWRSFPFNEHRTMAQVLETEALLKRRENGENMMLYAGRLAALQSRAVDAPEPPDAA